MQVSFRKLRWKTEFDVFNLEESLHFYVDLIGFLLCVSAYKYRTYIFNKTPGMIAESWTSQGFTISKLDMKEQKITFTKKSFKRTKVMIPKFLYRTDLPNERIEETNNFFYRLK